MDFTGKSVIVTGGASGMGAATARLFMASGAQVIIADRDAEGATRVATEIDAGAPLIGDVADSAFCDQCVATAVERTGRLDVLVNCAGTIVRADADSTSNDAWLRVMNVNVSGSFYMARAAVRVMRQQGKGAIINFGSIGALSAAEDMSLTAPARAQSTS